MGATFVEPWYLKSLFPNTKSLIEYDSVQATT
jgi:hypothetical protein